MVKVSVIIPVFNNENYLEQCVDSVLSQSMKDLEILLIDDGSTDASGAICDRYASLDSRIKVIHKSNTGVSDARNIALDIACGKYVIMLDSDDYWYEDTCLEKLYETAERYQLDIIRGEYKAVDSSGKDLFINELNDKRRVNLSKLLDAATFVENVIQREFFMCLCLVRRSCFNKICYNSARIFLEDVEVFLKILLKSPLCYYLPLRFYAYRKHSSTASASNSIKKLEDAFSMSYVFNSCAKSALDLRLKKYCLDEGIRRYFLSMSSVASEAHFANRRYIIKTLNLTSVQKDVKNWMAQTETSFKSPVYFLNPVIGVWYMKLRNMILDTVYIIRQFGKHLV